MCFIICLPVVSIEKLRLTLLGSICIILKMTIWYQYVAKFRAWLHEKRFPAFPPNKPSVQLIPNGYFKKC